MGLVKGSAVKEPRVFPLKNLGSKIPTDAVIDLIACNCCHQQQTHDQRQIQHARATQGADHKQQGIARQKRHDDQPCFDKDDQKQQGVDPHAVIFHKRL